MSLVLDEIKCFGSSYPVLNVGFVSIMWQRTVDRKMGHDDHSNLKFCLRLFIFIGFVVVVVVGSICLLFVERLKISIYKLILILR